MSISRLDKILVSQNIGSRKEVQKLIKKGNVYIDGLIEKNYSKKIDPNINIINICGENLNFRRYMYIMMNKPSGVISASNDPNKKTVIDLIPDKLHIKDLFPAGRLDIDTEGLLIITNDGDFSHKMLSPSKRVYKLYEALIDGKITTKEINTFNEGIVFNNGERCLPAKLNVIDEINEKSIVQILICQGKFHQIKKMFLVVGMKVLKLKRNQIGNLKLDENLAPGECRELTQEEMESIFL